MVTSRRDRLEHDQAILDGRVAAEHREAHFRSRDSGGAGCPYCL
jgi:hypothetical protein